MHQFSGRTKTPWRSADKLRERQLEPWRLAPNLKRDLPICRVVPTDCRPSKVFVERGWMESRNLLVREKFFAGRKWNQELDAFSQTAAVSIAVVPQVHTRAVTES